MAEPLTLLFLGANPDGSARLRLDREVRTIEQALSRTALRDRFKLVTVWASRFDDLLDGLLEHSPTVVHFSGHGRPGALLFEDAAGRTAAVSSEALARLFAAQRGRVRLVVFNACDSVGAARAVAPYVECAVGTLEPVGDQGARAFAAAFYRGIGYGRPIGEACELGRTAILAAGLEGADDVVLVPRAGIDPARLVMVTERRGGPQDPKVLDRQAIELTIELTRRGDEAHLRYLHDGQPLPGHGPGGGLKAPIPNDPEDGAATFALLFPDALARVEVMQTLSGSAVQPTPDRYRWRIRIQTTDARWLRWPWARASWRGQVLAAAARPWTFELSTEGAPRQVISLRTPARLLIHAPGRRADAERVRAALAAQVAAYGRDACTITETFNALRTCWRARPDVVYLMAPEPLLPKLLMSYVPTALYQDAEADDALAQRVLLGVVDARPDARVRTHTATRWLQQVLVEGHDPVATAATTGGGALAVHTRYARWETRSARDLPGCPHPRRRLDREVQRGRMLEQVHKLLETRARSAVAVVATGEPSHEIAALSELLEDHLKRRGRGQFRLRRRSVRFPQLRTDLHTQIRALIYDALQHDLIRPLADSLNAAGPRRLGDSPRVLWLDWGGFGRGEGLSAPLTLDQLRQWMQTCEHVLAEHCPPGLSLFCTLGVETKRRDLVEAVVDDYARDFRERFAAYTLPALAHVTSAELRDYFSDPDNTGIDRGLAGRAAEVLFGDTRGDYAALVRLIERGEQDGWMPLLDDLEGPTSTAYPGDTEL